MSMISNSTRHQTFCILCQHTHFYLSHYRFWNHKIFKILYNLIFCHHFQQVYYSYLRSILQFNVPLTSLINYQGQSSSISPKLSNHILVNLLYYPSPLVRYQRPVCQNYKLKVKFLEFLKEWHLWNQKLVDISFYQLSRKIYLVYQKAWFNRPHLHNLAKLYLQILKIHYRLLQIFWNPYQIRNSVYIRQID